MFQMFNGILFISCRLHAKQPLFGMDFMIIGEMKQSISEIEDKIRKMGGKIVAKFHTGIAAVISNEHEVNEATGNIRDAFIHRIQVIPERFLDDVMDNDPIEVIAKSDMGKWGKDVSVIY